MTVSPLGLIFDSCPVVQTLTITNTSAVPVTWSISENRSQLDIAPTSSTLAAGEAIAVSVIPKLGMTVAETLTVAADNAPSQLLTAISNPAGAHIRIPADVDFGNVPLGSQPVSVFIPIPTSLAGPGVNTLFGSAQGQGPFQLTSGAPQPQAGGFGWTLTLDTRFTPFQPLGPVQATLTFAIANGTVCPPNTFTARAVIVAQ